MLHIMDALRLIAFILGYLIRIKNINVGCGKSALLRKRVGADRRGVEPRCSRAARSREPAPARKRSGNLESLDQLLTYAVRQDGVGSVADCRCSRHAARRRRAFQTQRAAIGGRGHAQSSVAAVDSGTNSGTAAQSIGGPVFPAGGHRAASGPTSITSAEHWPGSLRLLPERVPTLESLNLPPLLRRLSEARQGLVLVTGPTGCGKSSTLAALVDLVNTQRHDHVVTIEDPVEFVHTNRQSIIEQIEVGRDAPDFAGSLRSILRQNPDVILVGEMRDPETIATVLTAAETGHLVLSTLHTNDTSQAVSRILDSFPAANQAQIRQQFSLALLAVVAQQLVPSARQGVALSGGRNSDGRAAECAA